MKPLKKAMLGVWKFGYNWLGKTARTTTVQVQNCGVFFTRNDPSLRLENRFIWFREWILERQTFKTLSRDSGLSIDTLQRTFYTYLNESPDVKILKREKVHLRIDATYFKRFCARQFY